MGYSIAWIAVQTADHAALFDLARVRPTDETDEVFEAPIAGAALKGGWFLLLGQGAVNRLIEPSLLKAISKRWPCVACAADERVTCSAVSFWRTGGEEWGVLHDAEKGIDHLATSGTPPASFEALRRAGDVFELPLLLAKEITGFMHDELPTNLAQPAPVIFVDEMPPRQWWKFW